MDRSRIGNGLTMDRVAYIEPLERGFRHMVELLFRPFDLGKWFVIGFSAWLSQFLGCSGGGSGVNFGWPPSGSSGGTRDREAVALRDLWEGQAAVGLDPQRFFSRVRDLLEEPASFALLGCGIGLAVTLFLALIAVILALLWVGSRGKFIFLDNVVHGRAEIREPWTRSRAEGNSLFAWYLGFFFVSAILILLANIPIFVGIFGIIEHNVAGWPLIVLGGVLLILVACGLSLVHLFLDSFIVPLMHHFGETATSAWRRFRPLLWERPGPFILYALLVLGLYILLGISILVLGIVTCCIGWILLAIPYIGTVILLPVWTTLRAFSVEFLSQLIPEVGLVELPVAESMPPRPGHEETTDD